MTTKWLIGAALAGLGCYGWCAGAARVPVIGPVKIDIAFPETAQPDRLTRNAEAAAAILRHPLFQSGRTAPRHEMTAATGDDLPRLTGIISDAASSTAIFEQANKAIDHKHVGDAVADWRITQIGTDTVDLARGDEALHLHPLWLHQAVAIATIPNPHDRWITPAAHGILRARWSNPQLQP